MISTVVSLHQPKDSSKGNITTQSHWRQSPSRHPFAIEKVLATKKPRPKVGRQFFEHDTRQNHNKINQKLRRKPQSLMPNSRGGFMENAADDHHKLTRLTEDTTTSNSGHDSKSPTSFGNAGSPTSQAHRPAPPSPEEVNNQLRKKLVKIQRQLRLQTEALRQHNLLKCAPHHHTSHPHHMAFAPSMAPPSGCCSCSYSSCVGTGEDLLRANVAMMQNHKKIENYQHIHRSPANHMDSMAVEAILGNNPRIGSPTSLFECNHHQGHVAMAENFHHPFRVQGLRSVVRYIMRRNIYELFLKFPKKLIFFRVLYLRLQWFKSTIALDFV